MTKDELLITIAESGYNIGYAAKKHLATYDMVEKLPGWIAFVSLAAGTAALFTPLFSQTWVSFIFIVIGIGSIFFSLYSDKKQDYEKAGSMLTAKYHELRLLYRTVKSLPPGSDLTTYIDTHQTIQNSIYSISINKQIFLSDWYAHYKFFWQFQIGWMDEQLHFKFLRDKLPLGFSMTIAFVSLFIVYQGIKILITFLPCLSQS